MKRWKVVVTVTALSLVALLGGCKKEPEQEGNGNIKDNIPADESVEDIYYEFVEDELVPELGVANLSTTSVTIHDANENWFYCDGILSAYIDDLDHDGIEDMLLLFMEKTDYDNDYMDADTVYHIVANVYTLENDTPVLKSGTLLARTDDEMLFYPSIQGNDIHMYVSAVEQDGATYIVFEEGVFANTFADGMNRNYWAYTYENEDLHFAYQFVQDGLGSAGMTYHANVYQNGKLTSSDLFYEMDSDSTYASYDEAVKAFFKEQGLEVAYHNFEKSIFAGTGRQNDILELHIQNEGVDYENSNFTFTFRGEDGTGLRDKITYDATGSLIGADDSEPADSSVPSSGSTVATDSVWEAYAVIVEGYKDAYELVQQSGPEGLNLEFINENYLYASTEDDVVPGFHVEDINGDGTPELFVGLMDPNGYYEPIIYDFYTYHNGTAQQLMSDLGYRSASCVLCEGGYIQNSYSSSAYEGGIEYLYLEPNATVLSLKEEVYSIADWTYEDPEVSYIRYNGTSREDITEDDYANTINSYTPCLHSLQKTTDDTLNTLRAGQIN